VIFIRWRRVKIWQPVGVYPSILHGNQFDGTRISWNYLESERNCFKLGKNVIISEYTIMADARVVAQQLAAKFLANGNYTFAFDERWYSRTRHARRRFRSWVHHIFR
jgi:hypothetical protein